MLPKSDEEANKNTMKRAVANDPVALSSMGTKRYEEGDYVGAFEYCTKAAELGDAMAHYDLSHFYQEGLGVEKDEKMRLYHLERLPLPVIPRLDINWYVSAVLCVLFCVAGPCCSVALGALCWQLLWVFFESLILTIKLLCNAVTTKYGRQVIA
eukprot:scaffold11353_cov140-Skeletonema_marinoi.AAC.1